MKEEVSTEVAPLFTSSANIEKAVDKEVAKVAILMCTYNGASFLAEQVNSFERQTHRNWQLYVSDDGSQDKTLDFLQALRKEWQSGQLQILKGPQKGFSANFLFLTCHADISADFYAWSDQDDIWKEEKLQKALAWLYTVPSHIPAVYCGRTKLISKFGVPCGYSPKFGFPPHFSNALVQNIGGGNTMVFNQAARSLLQQAGDDVVVPSHDWWVYQLVSGVGGSVYYDPEPTILYRQHDSNLVGSNASFSARFRRVYVLLKGGFCAWNGQNIQALETLEHRLTSESRYILACFKAARKQRLLQRFFLVRQAGLHRQTLFGNFGLIVAILLNKI
nr:glycosyltransferase family 2 protein [Pseudomonas sp. FFPRI_1]